MSDFYSRKNRNVSKLWFVVALAVFFVAAVVWQTRTTIADIEARVSEMEQFRQELLAE
jgi:cell division protein FtsL